MTVFTEHLLAGTFLAVFGMWLTVEIWNHYLKSLSRKAVPFRSQLSYPTNFCGRCRLDLMAILLTIAGIVGMVTQLMHIHHPSHFHNGSIDMTSAQHVTMYFFLGFAGFFKLLHPFLKGLLPHLENIEYIVLILAFTVEAFLFEYHLEGRDTLDIMLHTYSNYAVYGFIVMTTAELIFRHHVFFPLGRAAFLLLQGTWMWQLGFVLDSPVPGHGEWDPDDVDDQMLITCFFAWHVGSAFFFSLACGAVWSFINRRRGQSMDQNDAVEPVANGYSPLINKKDSPDPEV